MAISRVPISCWTRISNPRSGYFGLAREGSQTQYTHIKVRLLIVPLLKIVWFLRSVVYWERVRIYPMNICEAKRFQQRLTPTGMKRSFELIIKLSLFGCFNRIFYLFSYEIVLFELGTGLRAYDSHRAYGQLIMHMG
jgi:hypothetical protein